MFRIKTIWIFLRFQLGFSRSEFRGGLILVGAVIILSAYRMYANMPDKDKPGPDFSVLDVKTPVVESIQAFNPDTVSVKQLVSWGLPEKVAGTWSNYRSKVGNFRSLGQIQRLYGMPDSIYAVWKDSIVIQAIPRPAVSKVSKRQRACPPEMDLNYADSLMFVRLHGIGKVLSARIIRYRNRLGGYVDVSQLREVYGLKDSTYLHIRDRLYVDQEFLPQRIPLDSASYQQLYDHPYIPSKDATAILRYRRQHPGKVCLSDILAIDSVSRMKMMPYVAESCSEAENERPE